MNTSLINIFAAGNKPVCGGTFLYIGNKTPLKFSSKFCSNSEADASELLQNREEMFPRYCMLENWS